MHVHMSPANGSLRSRLVRGVRKLGPLIVCLALLWGTAPVASSTPAASAGSAVPTSDPGDRTAAKSGWCSVTKCENWTTPYYAHGIAYVPAWKRCVRWETRAKVRYRVARAVTGEGGKSHMVEGLRLTNYRMKIHVRRWCETSGNNPKRKVGGVLLLPSLHMTNGGSGRCTLAVSVGVSFPWSVGVSVTPTCDKANVATRDGAYSSGARKSTYRFSDAEPRKTQLNYKKFTTMLDPDDYNFPEYNEVCFNSSFQGSVEHPRNGNAKGISKSKVRCVNLLDGDPKK